MVEEIYDWSSWTENPPEAYLKNHILMNVALTVKNGGRFAHMSKQEFTDSVRSAYFMPQPSVMNIWYNLKCRSLLFAWFTAAWFAVFVLSLVCLRRLRKDLKYLSVLSAYIWSIFLIYHLASLAISIGLSYNYLLPAYIAFCLVAWRAGYPGKAGAV